MSENQLVPFVVQALLVLGLIPLISLINSLEAWQKNRTRKE